MHAKLNVNRNVATAEQHCTWRATGATVMLYASSWNTIPWMWMWLHCPHLGHTCLVTIWMWLVSCCSTTSWILIPGLWQGRPRLKLLGIVRCLILQVVSKVILNAYRIANGLGLLRERFRARRSTNNPMPRQRGKLKGGRNTMSNLDTMTDINSVSCQTQRRIGSACSVTHVYPNSTSYSLNISPPWSCFWPCGKARHNQFHARYEERPMDIAHVWVPNERPHNSRGTLPCLGFQ